MSAIIRIVNQALIIHYQSLFFEIEKLLNSWAYVTFTRYAAMYQRVSI